MSSDDPARAQARYDALPYPARAVAAAAPDHLAVLGRLFGLTPAAVGRCRVLELGCADGANLLPIALAYPESTCVGIDVSGVQVADGRAKALALGATNLTLMQSDLRDVHGGLGTFDYILCHGVWSWVDEPLRDRILALMRAHLAPHGVGYLSFNTMPGWHVLGLLRDILRRTVPSTLAPSAQIAAARRVMDTLAFALEAEADNPCAGALGPEVARARVFEDAYLFHEYLSPINTGEWFGDVVARASTAGLRYVAHARQETMVPDNFPLPVRALAAAAGDVVAAQEVLDAAQGRRFAATLWARADAPVSRDLTPARLDGLWFGVESASEASGADANANALSRRPRVGSGSDPEARLPANPWQVALAILSAHAPMPLTFPELLTRVAAAVGAPAETLGATLLAELTRLYFAAIVTLATSPPAFVATVSEYPIASALARWQVTQGEPLVTDQRHQPVSLSAAERALLPRLDGRQTRAALVAELPDAAVTLAGLARRMLLVG